MKLTKICTHTRAGEGGGHWCGTHGPHDGDGPPAGGPHDVSNPPTGNPRGIGHVQLPEPDCEGGFHYQGGQNPLPGGPHSIGSPLVVGPHGINHVGGGVCA
jgi:hypothetical protein